MPNPNATFRTNLRSVPPPLCWVIPGETSKAELPGSAPDQGPNPEGHGSDIWRFFMITSPFEASVGTVRRTFPGEETCDVQTCRRSDESFKF